MPISAGRRTLRTAPPRVNTPSKPIAGSKPTDLLMCDKPADLPQTGVRGDDGSGDIYDLDDERYLDHHDLALSLIIDLVFRNPQGFAGDPFWRKLTQRPKVAQRECFGTIGVPPHTIPRQSEIR